jgi:hypothetical protein
MEGGIAVLLLVLLILAIGAALVAFTGIGGALGLSRRTGEASDVDADQRPEHKRPTTPYHEHTRFVGAEHDSEPAEPH